MRDSFYDKIYFTYYVDLNEIRSKYTELNEKCDKILERIKRKKNNYSTLKSKQNGVG